MKKTLLLILTGFIPLIIVALFMKLVSLNLTYSFLVGMISLYSVSRWQNNNPTHTAVKTILISAPLVVAYYFLIVQELPGMMLVLPMFVAAVLFGLGNKEGKRKTINIIGMILSTVLISIFMLPRWITKDLSEVMNEPAPDFELVDLFTMDTINNDAFKNKVVVLDFFGTWCAPCIAEMKELKLIQEKLSAYDEDLIFLLACTDTGGDTPEKAKEFHARRKLSFGLVYDHGSLAHKQFKFSGVPGLVIIGKDGRMKFKHEGYNEAENLQRSLVPILRELLSE